MFLFCTHWGANIAVLDQGSKDQDRSRHQGGIVLKCKNGDRAVGIYMGHALDHARFCIPDNNVPVFVVYMKSSRKTKLTVFANKDRKLLK